MTVWLLIHQTHSCSVPWDQSVLCVTHVSYFLFRDALIAGLITPGELEATCFIKWLLVAETYLSYPKKDALPHGPKYCCCHSPLSGPASSTPATSHPPLDLTRHPVLTPSAFLLQAVPSLPRLLDSLSCSRPASNIHPSLGCHTASCFLAHATWEMQISGTGPARGVFSQLRLCCCLIIFLPPALGQSFSYYPQWPLIPSSIPLLNPSVLPGYTWPFLFHVSKLRLSDMTSLNSYTPLFPNQSLPTFSFTAPPPPTKSLGEFFF